MSAPVPPYEISRLEELLGTLLPPPRTVEDLEEWCSVGDPRTQPLATVYHAAERRRMRLTEEWTALGRILDALREGLMVCDRTGRVLHANPAMRKMLTEDPAQDRIGEEVSVLVRSVCLVARNAGETEGREGTSLERVVHGAHAEYTLRGIYLGATLDSADGAVLVVLEHRAAEPLSDGVLRERFGLTTQEVRIARFLAEGIRNEEIAKQLFISCHTVRHHVEKVLLKLGVRSRTEVPPLLRTGERSAAVRNSRRNPALLGD